jgi:protein-tyrosine phosphatase
MLHGWGAASAAELVELATLAVAGPTGSGWPACDRVDYADWDLDAAHVAHPLVEGVWIGGALALDELPDDIDAVVSLCRMGRRQVRDGVERYDVRLIDTVAEDNPNLDFVIDDAARTVLRLRDEGKRVYLHCVAAHSRTPTVATRVAVLDGTPLDEALEGVRAALPSARPQKFLVAALERLENRDARAAGATT